MLLGMAGAAAAEEKAVLAVVQRLFDAMAARDSAAALSVLLPEGRYFSVRENGAQVTVGGTSHKEFAERLASGKGQMLERMSSPQVLVHGRIAVVWTPYDFHRDGKYSHRGVDAFQLVKTAEGWKIASFMYTIEGLTLPPAAQTPR